MRVAAVADAAPDRVWDFHTALYGQQPAEGSQGLSDEQIADIAADAGVPADVVDRFTDGTFRPWVASVTQEAFDSGVQGTPTVKIDGEVFEGNVYAVGPLTTGDQVRRRRPVTTTLAPALTEPDSSRLHRLRHHNTTVWVTMLIASVASLVASFVLSVDALALAADPNADLGCNINAVISCGTVAASWQASLLGFPNAFLGLVSEPVVITLAVASLGGVRFPRWFMLSAQVVYTIGLLFAYWLFEQAMFEIGALCPWCLLITLATTLVFFEMTYVNIRDDNLFLPRRVQSALTGFVRSNLDIMLVIAWLLVLVLAVVLKYGEALFA